MEMRQVGSNLITDGRAKTSQTPKSNILQWLLQENLFLKIWFVLVKARKNFDQIKNKFREKTGEF